MHGSFVQSSLRVGVVVAVRVGRAGAVIARAVVVALIWLL
jgi:hypothetical protein